MQLCTHGVVTASLLALASGCASTSVRPQPHSADHEEVSVLRAQQQEQTRRIAELEARLGLLEADARGRRDASDVGRGGERLRNGAEQASARSTAAETAAEAEPSQEQSEADGKRPSLRLYGTERSSGVAARTAAGLPAVPSVSERLPVVALPEQRAAKALRDGAPPSTERSVEQYRNALRMLRERSFDQAIETFSRFIAENPQHQLLPSALYWRGEARYAKRDYAAARLEFEAIISRFPGADHAPDALFKLGLSLQKLGEKAQAIDAFERLRTDYPNSQAAQTAAREGST